MEKVIKKFNFSRLNLLFMIVITVVCGTLYLWGLDISYMFSAFIPIMAIVLFENSVVGISAAILILVFYLVSYLLSKKNKGFILLSIVLFIFDTILLGYIISLLLPAASSFGIHNVFAIGNYLGVSIAIKVVFHLWMIYQLTNATIAWMKIGREK